jgi:hypothetical protein
MMRHKKCLLVGCKGVAGSLEAAAVVVMVLVVEMVVINMVKMRKRMSSPDNLSL